MPTHFHAIVWIDHSQARIFHLGLTGDDEITLHPHLATQHLHHKANSVGSGHTTFDKEFLVQVTSALSDAGEILPVLDHGHIGDAAVVQEGPETLGRTGAVGGDQDAPPGIARLASRVRCPLTLIYCGTGTAKEREVQIVARRHGNARLVQVPETTHFLPMERPDIVQGEIERMLRAS